MRSFCMCKYHLTVVSFILLQFQVSAFTTLLSKNITDNVRDKKRLTYQHNLNSINQYRSQQAIKYRSSNKSVRKQILTNIRTRLEQELTENIFPAWDGTPWKFHGTSQKPGQGTIACGYFVSTCLTHLGYDVNRVKLAQQPSQRIIKTFMDRSAMDISSKRSLSNIKKQLIRSGNGIYIVGLDTHVGFVTVSEETITFVHSSYYRNPSRVVKSELYHTKNPLSDSNYRVFGKIFHDDMLIKWLNGHKYQVAK